METLPLSLLNDYLYCPRRAALKLVEGWRSANEHTILGDIVHDHADLPGYEVAKGVTLWRALPVWSERLGLNGKCDIVEAELSRPALKFEIANLKSLTPVEYKKGKRRQFDNDDAQLCAQAICLEEMFGITIARGAIFHAQSKRRREVEFTVELRALVERAAAELHALAPSEISKLKSEIPAIPPAPYVEGRCEECSLFEICLPKATCAESRAQRLAQALFEI
jgi:CRISPR-associated exonuclease Cas4